MRDRIGVVRTDLGVNDGMGHESLSFDEFTAGVSGLLRIRRVHDREIDNDLSRAHR
jgi:hypothetical protein